MLLLLLLRAFSFPNGLAWLLGARLARFAPPVVVVGLGLDKALGEDGLKGKSYLWITVAPPIVGQVRSAGSNTRSWLAPVGASPVRAGELAHSSTSASSLLSWPIADSNRVRLCVVTRHLYTALVCWRSIRHWLLKVFNHFWKVRRHLQKNSWNRVR